MTLIQLKKGKKGKSINNNEISVQGRKQLYLGNFTELFIGKYVKASYDDNEEKLYLKPVCKPNHEDTWAVHMMHNKHAILSCASLISVLNLKPGRYEAEWNKKEKHLIVSL